MARRPTTSHFAMARRELRRTAATRIRSIFANTDPRQLPLQLFVDFYADDLNPYRHEDARTKPSAKDHQ